MNFNLSEWALKNKGLVLYFMILLGLIGIDSYSQLSQSEDPPFTFKVMVIQTYWPGASAKEVSLQVTDRIEKELMTTGQYDRIMAYSRPGESMVTFVAKDSLASKDVADVWYNVRKKVGDIRHELPQGVQGPFFNDEFGDTFGNIYVLKGKDFDYATLKEYADRLQLQLQRVKDVAKVELIGLQDQKIWIEISNTKAIQLGVPVMAIQQALQQQNATIQSGFFETGSDRIQVRVSGALNSVEELRQMPLLVNGKTIQLGDVASIVALVIRHSLECALWVKTALVLLCPCARVGTSLPWVKIWNRNSPACKKPCHSAWSCKKSPTSRWQSNAVLTNL